MTGRKPLDASAKAMLKRAYSLTTDAETKAFYQDWSETYDDTMVDGLGYLSPLKAAKLLAKYVPDTSSAILDAGTGTGLVGQYLHQLGFSKIDGMDYSAPMLAVAGRRDIYRALIEADMNKPLPIGTDTYDAIICVGTFTHGHVGADCLDEMFRILKPGGKFVTVIRKDYWQSAGFRKKADEFERAGKIKTLHRQADSNYTTSETAESWYIVWQK